MARRKKTAIYEERWFWLLILGLIVISIYGGMRSGTVHSESIKEDEMEAILPNRTNTESSDEALNDVHWEDTGGAGGYSASVAQVTKLLQSGVIKRINENTRQLYVNDVVWKLYTYEQKDEVITIVLTYLDWVNPNQKGKIDVRSFRNGKRLAGTT